MIAMFKSVLLAASAATASAFVAGPALPVRTNAGRKLPLQCVLYSTFVCANARRQMPSLLCGTGMARVLRATVS